MIFVRDMRYHYQITQVSKKEIGDKQMKKVFGLGFIVASVVVLYFGYVGWPSLSVWSLIPVGLFIFLPLRMS